MPERLALLLSHLLQASGTVVGKETLALSVWPHEAVSDGNLAQHIYLLRRLLGDRARDHSYILSVQGRGYRFAAPVAIANQALNESFTADAAGLCFRNFCRGSFSLEQRTAPHIRRAIGFFDTALLMSPDYVPALIGLARAHSLLGVYWHAPSNLSFPPAKRAISRALEIDPGSASAHAVVSGLLCFADWDWRGAKGAIDVALRLNPGSTFVRNNAAWLHVCMGNYTEALAQAQFALTMDPSSLPLQLLLARVLVHSKDYGNAADMMSNLLEADPGFYIARRYRAQAYLLNGEPDKALADLQLLPEERSEDPSFRLPMLGRVYAELGDFPRAQKILETLQWLAKTDYVAFWNLAIVATGLGRLEEALSYLEAAYDQREATLPFLKSLPWFEPFAAAPRFKSLVLRVGPGV